MSKKIILFELNEVPFRVLNDFCVRFPESHIAKLYNQSRSVESVTPDTNSLHPWSVWPSIHRGVDSTKHQLINLSQDLTEVDKEFPPLWKILASNDINVGLGGSLQSWPLPTDLKNYSFYLPDTFSSDTHAHPPELEVFQKFNLAMVSRSPRNVSRGIALKEAFDVFKNAGKLGINFNTIKTIGGQVIEEMHNPSVKGRRRIIQSELAFDAFMKQLVDKKPAFSTFFTNHVASSLHRYWAAKYPEDFADNEYGQEWVDKYKDEIDYAMNIASNFAERLMKFTDLNRDYIILLATGMGQGANNGKIMERQVYVKDPELFMKSMGVEAHEYSQRKVMMPRFAAIVDESKRPLFEKNISSLKISGGAVHYEISDSGYYMLHFGQANLMEKDEFLEVNNTSHAFKKVGLKNTIIEDTAGATGYHIPEGITMIYDPEVAKGEKIETSISTTDLTPMILKNYGLSIPSYMSKPSSLL